jgi:anti-sigma B factor antagonist
MNLEIQIRQRDGVTVVSCTGRIVFGEETTALRDNVKRILSSSRQIVLNLSGVSYIDSGGLGTLVGLYSSARSASGDIKLSGLCQRVHHLLQITKLVTVFDCYDDEGQAVAAFKHAAV